MFEGNLSKPVLNPDCCEFKISGKDADLPIQGALSFLQCVKRTCSRAISTSTLSSHKPPLVFADHREFENSGHDAVLRFKGVFSVLQCVLRAFLG